MPGGVSAIEPVINYKVRELCTKAYPRHPKGCPNYGKRETCPPKAALLENAVDLSGDVFVLWNVFAFGAHVRKMKEAHPDWSQAQLECCLYWQGGARKTLRERVEAFTADRLGWTELYCPEACGVDVTATMAPIGQHLEWPPKTKAYQVALVGRPQ